MSFTADVLSHSPDLYLRWGEASGATMADSSGNSRDGSYVGTVTYGSTSLITGDADTAITFPGNNDNYGSVAVASWMDRSTFTAFVFFKCTDTGTNFIFTRWGTTAANNVWALDLQSSNGIRGYARIGGATRIVSSTQASARDGNVHMMAVTYDGAQLRLLYDGVSVGTPISIATALNTSATEGILVAKRAGDAATEGFNGTLDEGYFGPAISDADILALWTTATSTVVDLTPADSAHSHAVESPALTQTHELAPTDSLHAHAVEPPALMQTHELAPVDSTHAHTAESPALTQAHELAPSDAAHGHAADSPALTQVHELAPADSAHGHTTESPTLTVADLLVPADSGHGHASESPALTQVHFLTPDDSFHAHAAEAAALTQLHLLVAADSLHAHTSDGTTVGLSQPTPASRASVAGADPRTSTSSTPNRTSTSALADRTASN